MTFAALTTGTIGRAIGPRWTLVVGAAMLGLLVLIAIAPGLVSPYDPLAFDYQALMQPPSAAHPFGTDNFGRDVLSRTIWATRIDIQIAIFSTLFPLVFGTIVGTLVGYYGGWLDAHLRPAGRSRHHLPVPGDRDRHRGRARPGPAQHVYRGQRDRLGVLCPADTGRDPRAEAERLCRRRARAGLWRDAHHLPPPAAQRDHAGHRLLDDRHGARHPAGIEPRLSRPRRAAADGGVGRDHRRRQELHEHGVVDLGLSRDRHRGGRRVASAWSATDWPICFGGADERRAAVPEPLLSVARPARRVRHAAP